MTMINDRSAYQVADTVLIEIAAGSTVACGSAT